MNYENRVSWAELRDLDKDGCLEQYYVIADCDSATWRFYERSCWELRWYPIPSTEALVKRATKEIGGRVEHRQSNVMTMRQVA